MRIRAIARLEPGMLDLVIAHRVVALVARRFRMVSVTYVASYRGAL